MGSVDRLIGRATCAALIAAIALAGQSQEPSESSLEVTIRLLPENAVGPEEITRRIELPPAAENARPPPAAQEEKPPADDNRGRDGEPALRSARARPRSRPRGRGASDARIARTPAVPTRRALPTTGDHPMTAGPPDDRASR